MTQLPETARERTSVRPTIFGLAVALVLVVSFALRPPTADPSTTGLVWAGLFGALALGVVWPVVTVRTVGLRVLAAPSDLVVGQLGSIEVELTGRASGLSIGCTGAATSVVDVVSPGVVRLPLTVARRGEYHRLRIEVGSDAPFGVLWANRTRVVHLPRTMLVGPVSAPVDARAAELPGDLMDPLPSGHGSTGEAVRSVRPYVVGDPSHLVHWPSSARLGDLVVRELEPPAARGLAIEVDLRGDDVAAADAAASRAAGAAERVLEGGGRVLLCTAERSGPVAAEVADLLGVRRRLALAVDDAPATAPDGWPTLVVTSRPAGAAQPGNAHVAPLTPPSGPLGRRVGGDDAGGVGPR